MNINDIIQKEIEKANNMTDEQLLEWGESKECYDYLHR